MTSLMQHLVDVVTLGSLYALLGLAIALIFGIMRLINLAQGELIMVGAYGAVVVGGGAPWFLTLAVVLAVPVVFALLMERIAFRPIRAASEATLLVTSFAVSYLLQSLALLIFGADPDAINIGSALNDSFTVGEVVIPKLNVATVGATAVALIALTVFLKRTNTGVQMRAAAEDTTMARVLGVRINRVIATAFAISGLLSGIAAYLITTQGGNVFPTIGLNAILVAFIATVLGGLGSLSGAVLGGYALGAMTVVFNAYLPAELRPYTPAFTYAAVILVLLYRPQGLLVSRTARTRV